MLAYMARRLLAGVATVFVVSTLVFFMVTSVGDPLADLRHRPHVSTQTIRNLERKFHLDKPLYERYALWLGDVATGDLGTSYRSEEPVTAKLLRALGATGLLMAGWLLLSLGIAVPVGVYSALKPYSLGDNVMTGVSFVAYCAPVFLWAVLLQHYLAVVLTRVTGWKLFYVSGMVSYGGGLMNRIQHLALPVLTLAIATFAEWSRYQRSSMLDVLSADYIRTAKAKGLGHRRVVFRHALRNALIPLVTVVGLEAGLFVSGAVVTEYVFAWPGMGRLFLEALGDNDFPVVMGFVIVTTVIIVLFNLVVDFVYTLVDPRIRYD